MPNTIVRAVYVLVHLNITITVLSKCYYYPILQMKKGRHLALSNLLTETLSVSDGAKIQIYTLNLWE